MCNLIDCIFWKLYILIDYVMIGRVQKHWCVAWLLDSSKPPPVHLQLPSFPGKPHRICSRSTQMYVSFMGTSQKSSRKDNNNNNNNNNNNQQPKKHQFFSSSMKHHLNHHLLEKFHPFVLPWSFNRASTISVTLRLYSRRFSDLGRNWLV